MENNLTFRTSAKYRVNSSNTDSMDIVISAIIFNGKAIYKVIKFNDVNIADGGFLIVKNSNCSDPSFKLCSHSFYKDKTKYYLQIDE